MGIGQSNDVETVRSSPSRERRIVRLKTYTYTCRRVNNGRMAISKSGKLNSTHLSVNGQRPHSDVYQQRQDVQQYNALSV